jgi:hypothetical protein
VLSYNIATEITLASGRGQRVGSPMEKGGIGEAGGCGASERHGHQLDGGGIEAGRERRPKE